MVFDGYGRNWIWESVNKIRINYGEEISSGWKSEVGSWKGEVSGGSVSEKIGWGCRKSVRRSGEVVSWVGEIMSNGIGR